MYRDRGGVVKAQEPLVSYEQVLLLQISRCGTSYRRFPLCVDNLVSMLPPELAEDVNRLYSEIDSIVTAQIKQLGIECCEEYIDSLGVCRCGAYEALRSVGKVVERILKEHPSLLKFRHAIASLVDYKLRFSPNIPSVAPWKLRFAIATQLLMEKKLLAPKAGQILVGHAEE